MKIEVFFEFQMMKNKILVNFQKLFVELFYRKGIKYSLISEKLSVEAVEGSLPPRSCWKVENSVSQDMN